MNGEASVALLHQHLPDARARFVFESRESSSLFSGQRVDILYVFPPETHAGLLHWVDERTWHEDQRFYVAMELSKFCRLLMKRHPHAMKMWGKSDVLNLAAWPTDVDVDAPVNAWLERLNRWLHHERVAAFSR